MISFLILMMMGPVQKPDDVLGPQVENLISESEDAAINFVQVFTNNKNADAYVSVADQFVEISKPIQARHFYKAALEIDANLASAKAGVAKTEERLKYLKDRIKLFDGEIKKTNHYTKYCSKAAVLFHMGRENEAMVVLDAALEAHETDQKAMRQIRALRYTFQQGIAIKRRALMELGRLFTKAVEEKQLQPALGHLGQLAFLSQGYQIPQQLVDHLTSTFPKEVNTKHLKAVLNKMPVHTQG